MDWLISIKENIIVITIVSLLGSVFINIISNILTSRVQTFFLGRSKKRLTMKVSQLELALKLMSRLNENKVDAIFHVVKYIIYIINFITIMIFFGFMVTFMMLVPVFYQEQIPIIISVIVFISVLAVGSSFHIITKECAEVNEIVKGVLDFPEYKLKMEKEINALKSNKHDL